MKEVKSVVKKFYELKFKNEELIQKNIIDKESEFRKHFYDLENLQDVANYITGEIDIDTPKKKNDSWVKFVEGIGDFVETTWEWVHESELFGQISIGYIQTDVEKDEC